MSESEHKTVRVYEIAVVGTLIAAMYVLTSCGAKPAYGTFCNTIAEVSDGRVGKHVAIYLDVGACLSCCESMVAWQELEQKLPECGGSMSLWAPLEDSVDVAVAMELEGLKTPVRVLSDELVEALKWKKAKTPIKVLFDDQCKPQRILGPASGGKHSAAVVKALLAAVCSPE